MKLQGLASSLLSFLGSPIAATAAAALVLAAAAAPGARADPLLLEGVRSIGGGYQLYFDQKQYQLRVRKAGRSAPLEVGATVPLPDDEITITASAAEVTLTVGDRCAASQTYSHDQLAARLDNAEGLALLRRKPAEAAARFARAASLDPTYLPAAAHHAESLLTSPRATPAAAASPAAPAAPAAATPPAGPTASSISAAAAALAPPFAAHPLRTYLHVAANPKLALLTAHAPLATLRAATRGTATLDAATLALSSPGLARSPRGWLATVETTSGHGMCAMETRLVLRDERTLGEVAALPLLGPADYLSDACEVRDPRTRSRAGRARVTARVAAANLILADLGFSAAGAAVSLGQASSGTPTAHVGELGLAFGGDGSVRVFHQRRLLAEHPAGTLSDGQHETAFLLPAPAPSSERRLLVVSTQIGCHRDQFATMDGIPLPPAPAPAPAAAPKPTK